MERSTPHNRVALEVMQRISNLGIIPSLQQRIGAFAVVWGLFETNLESAIWALKEENVAGVRPSTERMQMSEWLKVLANGHARLSVKANNVLRAAAEAAEDLMDYRHSIFHGHLGGFGTPGEASFLRNPRWNGEVRKKEFGDAHVSESLLDMAIEAGFFLFRVAIATKKVLQSGDAVSTLEDMQSDVARARSFSGELRHLTALMNHEKY